MKKDYTILAIESSCDETAAAVVRNGREVLSSVISSQIPVHARYGGVVPEVASRNHINDIDGVVKKAVADSGVGLSGIDAVAATYGAGLVGALLVGLSYAKGLAFSLGVPLIAVNHIQGHIAANYIAFPELAPPFLCLVASGGHTSLVRVGDYTEFEVLGATKDDAAGEAFDKVARVLGLPYPGGPNLERLAETGRPDIEFFKKTGRGWEGYDFSYSGLKTAVINYHHALKQKNGEVTDAEKADIAASFQKTAVDIMLHGVKRAAAEYGLTTLCVGGGVAANRYLSAQLKSVAAEAALNLLILPLSLCGDNAAMIGAAAFNDYRAGKLAPLSVNAEPSLKITD